MISALRQALPVLLLVLFTLLRMEPALAAAAGAGERVSLQLKWLHQFQFAGYYAALAQGYYAEEGLEVEIREIDRQRNVVDQVVAGEADYGVGDSGIVAEYANGQPIVALAAIFQHSPLVFVAKQSSGIISPYEMAGKRIMYNSASRDDAPLRGLLADAGLGRDRYTHVPQTFRNEALLHDEVDVMSAYLTNEPYDFRQQGVPVNIINPQNYGFDFYGDLLFTSQRELSEHPGRAERFRRASLRGWHYALAHPDELVRLIHSRYASARSVEHLRYEAAETRKLILEDVVPLGQIEVARLRRAADIYARLGLAKPLDEARLRQFVYAGSLELTPDEHAWLQQHPVIRVGVDRDFAPYEWVDDKGNYVGLVADYMRLLEQRLGVRFAIVKDKTWHEILAMAERGELDMIAGAVRTGARERYLLFTQHYVSNPAIIVSDARNGYIGSLARLAGKRVAVQQGYFVQDRIAREYPDIQLIATNSIEQALGMVATGKADAYVGDALSANYAIKRGGYPGLHFSGQSGYQSETAVAVSKQHPQLLGIVQKALDAIPPSEREALLNRWMGVQVEVGISRATMLRYGGGILLLFLLFAYWLMRLLREVRARQSSEAQLASLYTSMTLGFALHQVIRDASGKVVDYRFLDVNPAFEKLTGIARERWVGHSMREVLPDTEDYWFDEYGKVVDSGEPRSLQRYAAQLGRWYSTYSYRTAPEQFAVLVEDVTASKLASRREQSRNQVMEQLTHGAALPQILQSIVHYVEQDHPDMLCSILLLDEEHGRLRVGAAPSLPDFYTEAVVELEPDSERCSCLLSLQKDELVVIPDLQCSELCPHYRDIVMRAGLGSCWSEPIHGASGQLLGTFTIYHRTPKAPAEEEISIIEHAAGLAALAIERSRSDEALQLAHLVYQNSAEAMVVTDADNRIVAINPAFTTMTGYTLEEVRGQDPGVLGSGRQSGEFYRQMWDTLSATGQWQGEIWNRRKNGEEFAEWLSINTIFGEGGKVLRRVALFSDITEKKRADALIWTQANYDALTRLPNRRLFGDRLAQVIKKSQRDGENFALLFLDLDRFKEVNDTLGHQRGDDLLVDAAQRICRCVRDTDTVARLGGDEFTIILAELHDLSVIERVAQNIIAALDEPFQLGDDRVYISVSIGITVYPHDATSVDELLKNADQAMYAAKKEGRGRSSYFTRSMQEAAQTRVRLSRDLRQALAAQQFEVYYQPIVELATGGVRKAEALLRWRHPEQGYISPAAFIPIAEETGAIHEIGDWVFRRAAQQVGVWRQRFAVDFQVSINKSPVQFHAEGARHDDWMEYLQQMGLGGSIVIEITESVLLNVDGGIADKLLAFRDAGIQVAIDDFGTGYSSLAYLNKFDIDYLKIDQSFTRHLETEASSQALCEAIISMAHKLGLKVIAEGVETPRQREILMSMGCDYAQGYLFSPPLPAPAFELLLQGGLVAGQAPAAPALEGQ